MIKKTLHPIKSTACVKTFVCENNEQVNSLEVVEVMELRRGQEGQVVSTVGDVSADQSQAVPEGGGGEVGAHDHGSNHHRQRVGDLRVKNNNRFTAL